MAQTWTAMIAGLERVQKDTQALLQTVKAAKVVADNMNSNGDSSSTIATKMDRLLHDGSTAGGADALRDQLVDDLTNFDLELDHTTQYG